jgi:hypothetical protein
MVQRIVPDLLVDDLPSAVKDYAAVLRLDVVMDLGTVVTLADSDGHQLNRPTTPPSVRGSRSCAPSPPSRGA